MREADAETRARAVGLLLTTALDRAQPTPEIRTTTAASGAELTLVTGLADPVAAWVALWAPRSALGLWPVLLGGNDELAHEGWDDPRFAGGTALEIARRRAEMMRNNEPAAVDHGVDPAAGQHRFNVEHMAPEYLQQHVALGVFVADHGWQVIEQLAWEDGNTWPSWFHRDMLRRWEERHGAGLAMIDGTTLALHLDSPVSEFDVAVELAAEQLGYGDTVGALEVDGFDATVAMIRASTVWGFWWD